MRNLGEAVTIISVSIHWQTDANCIKIQELRTAAEQVRLQQVLGLDSHRLHEQDPSVLPFGEIFTLSLTTA